MTLEPGMYFTFWFRGFARCPAKAVCQEDLNVRLSSDYLIRYTNHSGELITRAFLPSTNPDYREMTDAEALEARLVHGL